MMFAVRFGWSCEPALIYLSIFFEIKPQKYRMQNNFAVCIEL